jgi:O-antigen/teichoic acid export membrane protein
MAIPAVGNLVLNLILIPRFGLNGALWSTLASYALGAATSVTLGRGVLTLPIPWETLGRAVLASAVMAVAVAALPSPGGWVELVVKAATGVAVYALAAFALDLCGARTHSHRLVRALQARSA